jgi:hypothetical protein
MSEVVRDAMKDYLFAENMEETRRTFTSRVQKRGVSSEQELIARLES